MVGFRDYKSLREKKLGETDIPHIHGNNKNTTHLIPDELPYR